MLADELLANLKAALFDPNQPAPLPGEIEAVERQFSRIRHLSDEPLVREYQAWVNAHPDLLAAMVRAAQRLERAERRALGRFINEMVHQDDPN